MINPGDDAMLNEVLKRTSKMKVLPVVVELRSDAALPGGPVSPNQTYTLTNKVWVSAVNEQHEVATKLKKRKGSENDCL